MYVAWAVLLACSFATEAYATKYLDSFTTSPGPLERQITVAWSSSNFSLPDSDEITLVLHNISGAWKRYTGQRLWTFSVNCRNSGETPKTFKGAPFVEVEYDPNCDYVDISNRTDVRSQLINVSYILDVYLPTDKDHRVVSSLSKPSGNSPRAFVIIIM